MSSNRKLAIMSYPTYPTPPQPDGYYQSPNGGYPDAVYGISFVDAVKRYFSRYAEFRGHASRSEYWFSALFVFLSAFTLSILASIGGAVGSDLAAGFFVVLYIILALGTLVPSIAVAVRRIRDAGFSGWLYLVSLVPFLGGIAVFVLLLLPTKVVQR